MVGVRARKGQPRTHGHQSGRELFGWQGLRFEHPEDWAPVTLSGTWRSGYALLASPGSLTCQVRWQAARTAGDLEERLRNYFAALTKRAGGSTRFHGDFEKRGDAIEYRWRGDGQGRGVLLFSEACSRVIFLELTGRRNHSLLTPFREVLQTFRSGSEDGRLTWSLFGLRLRLPEKLRLESSRIRAGHTRLEFRCRRLRLEAQRWGFAEQLIARHGLEGWARAVLNLEGARATWEPEGLRLVAAPPMLPLFRRRVALVRYEEGRNQICTLCAKGRGEGAEPGWDWFG